MGFFGFVFFYQNLPASANSTALRTNRLQADCITKKLCSFGFQATLVFSLCLRFLRPAHGTGRVYLHSTTRSGRVELVVGRKWIVRRLWKKRTTLSRCNKVPHCHPSLHQCPWQGGVDLLALSNQWWSWSLEKWLYSFSHVLFKGTWRSRDAALSKN